MSRLAGLAIVALLLAGCDEHPETVAVDPCTTPALATPVHAVGTVDGETERVVFCMKTAVRELDRSGGPVEAAAKAAVQRCARDEQAQYAAMARKEPVYQWEKDEMHDMLEHTALLTARQTRSRGCGRPGGVAEEP